MMKLLIAKPVRLINICHFILDAVISKVLKKLIEIGTINKGSKLPQKRPCKDFKSLQGHNLIFYQIFTRSDSGR